MSPLTRLPPTRSDLGIAAAEHPSPVEAGGVEHSAKNRVHFDFHAADREAEIARLVGLGATRHDTHHEFGVEWTVLTDPEGNEFCVAQQ